MKKRIEIIMGVIISLGILAAGCGRITTTMTPAMTTTSNPTQTSLPTTTDISGFNSTSTETVNGLSLSLSTDRTTYQPGQVIAIT